MRLIVWEVNLVSYLSGEYVDWNWMSWKSKLIEFNTSSNWFSRLWCSFRTIPPIVCFWNRVHPCGFQVYPLNRTTCPLALRRY